MNVQNVPTPTEFVASTPANEPIASGDRPTVEKIPGPAVKQPPDYNRKLFYVQIVSFLLTTGLLGVQAWLMFRQTVIFGRPADIMETQAKIMGDQTHLIEAQTELARTSITPKFAFLSKDLTFRAENQGEPVRELCGCCIPFIQLDLDGTGQKNVELLGYFNQNQTASSRSVAVHFSSGVKDIKAIFRSLFPYLFKMRWHKYLELEYVNRAGEKRIERYTMSLFGGDVKTVNGPPTIDATFNLEPFISGKETDEAGLTSAFGKLVDSLKQSK